MVTGNQSRIFCRFGRDCRGSYRRYRTTGLLLAEADSLPFIYVRSDAKKHGMQNRIEGRLQPGDKVLVIEDLISTGGSSLAGSGALRQAGADVVGLAALFT